MKLTLFTALTFIFFALQSQTIYNLEQCISMALQNNLDIQSSHFNRQQAENYKKIAKTDYLPKVYSYANYNYVTGNYYNNQLFENEKSSMQTSNVGIAAELSLFQGMRRVATEKQANIALQQTEAEMSFTNNEIAKYVAAEYINVLYLYAIEKSINEQIEITKQQLLKAEKLHGAGALVKSELLRLKYLLSSENLLLIENSNSIKNSLINIEHLVNYENKEIQFAIDTSIIISNIDASNFIPIDSAYFYALNNMPEIQIAKLEISKDILNTDIAKAAFYPTLDLGYSYGTQHYSSIENTLTKQYSDNLQSQLGLRLNVPIFNKGHNKAFVTKAKIEVLNSELKLNKQQQKLYRDITIAYNDLLAAKEKYQNQQEAIQYREESFRLAKVQFENENINSIDYNIEKSELLKAIINMEQAKFQMFYKQVLYNFYINGSIQL